MRGGVLAMALGIVCLFVTRAIGDTDVFVANRTIVFGQFSPADERETLRAQIPGGALLSVRARGIPDAPAKKGGAAEPSAPVVKLELFDPSGHLVKSIIGGKHGARIRMRTLASGTYRIVVSGDGEWTGLYQAAVAWKSPRRFRSDVELAGDEIRVPFTADAGSVATLSIASSRGAGIFPRLVRVEGNGFSADLVTPPASDAHSHKLTGTLLPVGGDLYLVVTDEDGAPGGAHVSVRVIPPHVDVSEIDVGDSALGLDGIFGGEDPTVKTIGKDGGTLTVPTGDGDTDDLAGTSIDIPPDSLSNPTSVVIARAEPPIESQAAAYAAASAAVFFGPQDAAFASPATVTLVYDSNLVVYPSTIRIFERLADGTVRLVPRDSYIIDAAAHTISFPVTHLAAYQVFAPIPLGPDAFGYTARAIPFSYEDISATGTPHLAAPGFEAVDLPFTFSFYGEAFTKLYVSDDGLITFLPPPFATEPNRSLSGPLDTGGAEDEQWVIAPLWDDLTLPAPGIVYTETRGEPGERRTIVQWKGVGHADGGESTADFEVILYEGTNDVLFQYWDVTFGVPSADYGNSATVGIRAPNGHANGRVVEWSFDAPFLDFCDAILFTSRY